MNILNVSQNYLIRGGSDQYFFSLGELLAREHVVIPFSTQGEGNVPTSWSSFFPDRVNFENPGLADLMNFVYSFPAASAIKRLLKQQQIDVAHLHIYYGQLTSSILSPLKRRQIPIVQTLHEYKIVCPVYSLTSNEKICQDCHGTAFWHCLWNRCNRGSTLRSLLSTMEAYVSRTCGAVEKIDHFIAVSDFVKNKVIELGLPPQKVTTIHNFIDASQIIPNQKPGEYFLYFGRLERVKGIFTLLEAFAPLKASRLLIAGTGSSHQEIQAWLKTRNLDHIKLLGFQRGEQLHKLIENSICTLVPSLWYEPFGLTIIESFSRGRPVIASDIGGIGELISDSVDGFLIPPGSVDALREKLLWMMRNREKAASMGMEGRKKVEDAFNPDIHYRKIMEVYKKVTE